MGRVYRYQFFLSSSLEGNKTANALAKRFKESVLGAQMCACMIPLIDIIPIKTGLKPERTRTLLISMLKNYSYAERRALKHRALPNIIAQYGYIDMIMPLKDAYDKLKAIYRSDKAIIAQRAVIQKGVNYWFNLSASNDRITEGSTSLQTMTEDRPPYRQQLIRHTLGLMGALIWI